MRTSPPNRFMCALCVRRSWRRRSETLAIAIDPPASVSTSVAAAIAKTVIPLAVPPVTAAWLARLASSGPVQPNPAMMNPNP